MHRQRIWTLGAVAAVLIGVIVAVVATRDSGGSSAAAPTASAPPPVPVVVPGKPGESARVINSDELKAPDGDVFNGVDVTFAQMMIVHHQQALLMADLAPERAGGAELKALAARISIAQRPEITILQTWLRERRQPESDASHDHATMAGMQSDARIAELTAARGADFDRLWVTMMTEHHMGALQMVDDVTDGGTDQRLSEVAAEMSVEQKSEIRRMAQLGAG
jgi:uncharacterized protein (DUF305 family)